MRRVQTLWVFYLNSTPQFFMFFYSFIKNKRQLNENNLQKNMLNLYYIDHFIYVPIRF